VIKLLGKIVTFFTFHQQMQCHLAEATVGDCFRQHINLLAEQTFIASVAVYIRGGI